MQLACAQVQYILKQMIRFTDELHIAVFDAIVYHFDIVASTVNPNISRASIAIHFGRNGCEDRLN
ncbi:hypothetical protein D3C73_1249240 [compost metagenome]